LYPLILSVVLPMRCSLANACLAGWQGFAVKRGNSPYPISFRSERVAPGVIDRALGSLGTESAGRLRWELWLFCANVPL
ncbi:MAG: hypothetical protein ACREMY_27435, partial [bacterium]